MPDITMIFLVLCLLVLHGLLGGADVILNHELIERLPSRIFARLEEALHSTRELIFALLFGGLAWFEWHGMTVLAIAALIIAEITISLWDTLLEDKTRKLSYLERSLHVFLFVNFGAYTALLVGVMSEWWSLPTSIETAYYGVLTWILSGLSLLSFCWCLRDAASFFTLGHRVQERPGATVH